ncbi:hypothetical protein ACFFHM_17055 [Halalkalibacter kiskunsagensis]|uniref:Transposase n=1 Tax=Halalkalibacter kiskunsagensis TaxID=1548599 RepID=A0ABV6KFU2_9BACI
MTQVIYNALVHSVFYCRSSNDYRQSELKLTDRTLTSNQLAN